MRKCSSTAILPCIGCPRSIDLARPPTTCDKMTAKSRGDHSRMVTTQAIALAHDGSRTFDAYLARPDRQGAEHHDLHRDVRHRAAQSRHGGRLCAARLQRADTESVLALAPFRASSPSTGRTATPPGRGSPPSTSMPPAAISCTAVQWLRAQPFSNGKVFALGFCAGGRMAFVAAARAECRCRGVVLRHGHRQA